jgi:UDP-glucose 4-epimerase
VIVRLFNTVGPRQTGRYGMVIPRFVEWALANKPIQIYGDGQQTRCFCCVHDVTGGLVQLMDWPDATCRVFNLGSNEEISIQALADRVIEQTGSTAGKELLSYEQAYGRAFDDMMRRVPCLDRINQAIGFKPQYTLDQTLQRIIDEMKSS